MTTIPRGATRQALLAVSGAAALAIPVDGASAEAATTIACPDAASQVFLRWGDMAQYALVPDGGFELGAAGWTLTGRSHVRAGNESFHVNDPDDRRGLRLEARASVTTPPMCIGVLSGKMRLFTSNAGDAASRLRVEVLYGGGLGGVVGGVSTTLGVADMAFLTSGASWQPSPEVAMLGGVAPLLTDHVRFRFSPADHTGRWRIDDVYLDPLKHG